ncbi:conserved hypothetical protein [Neospora caninum Liverpool]|uniref:Transmembrane protein n=1 Tax=Neospora caninum (strain Liverpool) TaxID=572307 RepID=F0VL50_NEOCL|nr:conserved hypothetical protein [Neospora caninum Liverpool]CBZ54802.1 conserved hypothetical protein [Neospora caninum Liverpool]CEL69521.1 TPA: hypothetical protein BN1204_052280 [Neospora caninum Liverpool]|eukprot:XP_003884830.1 conserved hypothetical protein [Neospora caninum Liverpool]
MGTDEWPEYAGGEATGWASNRDFNGFNEEDDYLRSYGKATKEALSSTRYFSKGILTKSKDPRTQKLKQLIRLVAVVAVIAGLVTVGVKTTSVLREVSTRQTATEETKKQLDAEMSLDQAYLDRANDIEQRIEQKKAQITELEHHLPDEVADEHRPQTWKHKMKKMNIKQAFGSLSRNKRKKHQSLNFLPRFLPPPPSDEAQQPVSSGTQHPASMVEPIYETILPSRLSDASAHSSSGGSLGDPFRNVVYKIEDEMRLVSKEESQWQKKHDSVRARFKEAIGKHHPESGPHGQMWKMAEEIQVPGTHPDAQEWLDTPKKSTPVKDFFRKYMRPAVSRLLEEREPEVKREIAAEREKLVELERLTGDE